ncbi:aminotransferase [Pacificimonas flava]|uniref:Aminotransferase n=2 Tax=Pacificimonas TaxID=1960290 RepID=A0A219B4I6_9SPHN|nr:MULTISPECIES: aminotransferase class V-fold PLP-dependent enzyme [Pacificimonas]MBZ6377591.1 aminotransferase class V-fold PLP-dependent enzyme [Pacificimonas aurantium]OWV32719.1 aminotransferase [Pacificimonas flava]
MTNRLSRRSLLAAAGAVPVGSLASRVAAAAGSSGAGGPEAGNGTDVAAAPALPDRRPFAAVDGVYLDSGTMHPVPQGALEAVQTYFATRTAGGRYPTHEVESRVKANFAKLINASPEELAFVQSTTAGEQLVIDALDIPASGGRIVTDTLHFFGSFYLYEQLERQGMAVTWLRPTEGRIDVEAYERAIKRDTRLVSLSLVSTYNGFEHDLAAICEIAHARGAHVYADIIHAAGTVPIDVRASGVDFAATASYKWLMGDFGLGFLYVRSDLLERIRRPRYGYYQIARFQPHVYPFDPPADDAGSPIADIAPRTDAQGHFAMGTHSHAVAVQLDWSLAYLLECGIERIAAHRLPMLERLHEALPGKGYSVVTPRGGRAPLLTCTLEGAYNRLAEPLAAAGVKITLSRNRFRICPSLFNDIEDIERLIDVLPAA